MKKFLILICITLSSCINNYSSGFSFDNNINPKIRKEIITYNERIFDYLKNDEPEKLYDMLSENVRKKQSYSAFLQFFYVIKELPQNHEMIVYKEFYSYCKTGSKKVHYLVNPKFKEEAYRIEGRDTIYFSLLTNKAKPTENLYLLSILYVKSGSKWEIDTLHVGQKKIQGLSYHQLIDQGEILLKENKYFPAMFRFLAAKSIEMPTPFQVYDTSDKQHNFLKKIEKTHFNKYQFPKVLEKINTKPLLLNIVPEYVTGGMMPVVSYKTNIIFDEKHKQEIEEEKNKVAKYMKKEYPSIASEYNLILFQIFEKIPHPNSNPQTYKTKYEFK